MITPLVSRLPCPWHGAAHTLAQRARAPRPGHAQASSMPHRRTPRCAQRRCTATAPQLCATRCTHAGQACRLLSAGGLPQRAVRAPFALVLPGAMRQMQHAPGPPPRHKLHGSRRNCRAAAALPLPRLHHAASCRGWSGPCRRSSPPHLPWPPSGPGTSCSPASDRGCRAQGTGHSRHRARLAAVNGPGGPPQHASQT